MASTSSKMCKDASKIAKKREWVRLKVVQHGWKEKRDFRGEEVRGLDETEDKMMDGAASSPSVNWGRPDADDCADANEQNMRRHPPPHPLFPLQPRPPSFLFGANVVVACALVLSFTSPLTSSLFPSTPTLRDCDTLRLCGLLRGLSCFLASNIDCHFTFSSW